MKTQYLLFILVSIFFGCKEEKKESDLSSNSPPNIIFIMTDDHAFQAISAYDETLIKTPNIDRLAEEGMRFDRAFVTNSICAPSRAVILTGKHSHLNGIRDNGNRFDSTQQTFPKILRANGYTTAMIGKWHLKTQPTGFDFWKVLPGQGDYYHPRFRTPDGMVMDSGYVTDLITDEAIDWLKNDRDQSKPFLLMYQHKAPHREWWPKQDKLAEFTKRRFPEPATLHDDYEGRGTAARTAEMRLNDHMGWANDTKLKPELVTEKRLNEFLPWYTNAYNGYYNRMSAKEQAYWDEIYDPINDAFRENTPSGKALTSWKYQRYMQDYLACIASVDENVGRLMDQLEEMGLSENTIVVYTSDQGFYLGEHGWFDKRFMYEESFRTPLMIKWPSVIKAGQVNTDLVQNLDFAETFLDAAGIQIPNDMQGKSMLPLLKGKKVTWRDALYYQYYEYPSIHAVKRHYGVRTDRYKLIHFYNDIDEWELYDLENDPKEMNNVYENPGYADVRKQLHKRLDELREQYEVPAD
jgi:arylsulfatase A-like enzyme